jgi:hypothetical protein
MFLGDQTVGFVTITDGALDELGIPAQVRTTVNVPGCRFRPLSAAETVDLTDVATEVWKCTAPPSAAALVDATGELVHDGVTYQVIGGPKPYPDAFRSDTFKVTVMCEKQVG